MSQRRAVQEQGPVTTKVLSWQDVWFIKRMAEQHSVMEMMEMLLYLGHL